MWAVAGNFLKTLCGERVNRLEPLYALALYNATQKNNNSITS